MKPVLLKQSSKREGEYMSKFVKVDGLPISRLKDNYVVLVLQSTHEFEQLVFDSKEPIFFDYQKAYCIKGKNCFIFFHDGPRFIDVWIGKNEKD
jgi:hypothetical protein